MLQETVKRPMADVVGSQASVELNKAAVPAVGEVFVPPFFNFIFAAWQDFTHTASVILRQ